MKGTTDLQTKSKGLGFVVQSSFLRTVLIPILTVELVLLCLYFFSNHYINEKNLDLLRSNATETILEISKSEARYIDDQLREISRNNRSLQAEHQSLFMYSAAKSLSSLETQPSNELGKIHRFANSSVFVSSNTQLGSEVSEKIVKTEKMEVRFAALVNANPNLISSYFVSWDNVVRLYPFLENFYDQYAHDFDFTKRNIYYLANEKHNPDKTSFWTDTYLDPSGKG